MKDYMKIKQERDNAFLSMESAKNSTEQLYFKVIFEQACADYYDLSKPIVEQQKQVAALV